MITKKIYTILLLSVVLLTIGCGEKRRADQNRPEPIPVPEEQLELTFIRFEQDLSELKRPIDAAMVKVLRTKYGEFFELWCTRLSGIVMAGEQKPADAEIALNLNQYLSDKYIQEVFADCKKKYSNLDWLKEELEPLFLRYKKSFPGKPVPTIMTYLSPFSSNVMAMDSVAGIGLHFYLGADYKFYPSLQLPLYMVRKMEKEYIVNDLLKGWIDSEYLDDSAQSSCLAQMIYHGKVMYATEVLSPETDDTIITGYQAPQLDWAYAHEEQIWGFFIEQNLLYKTNPKVYIKYIHDGNTTGGFPKEAPAKLGPFIGWQIVRSYMKNHPGMNLLQLFSLKDAQKILAESGYKPPKKAA